jgi:hypothetical protein
VGQFVEEEITSVLNLSLQIGRQCSSEKIERHLATNRNEPEVYLVLKLLVRLVFGGYFGLKPCTSHMKSQIRNLPFPSTYFNKMAVSIDWASFNDSDFPLSIADHFAKALLPQMWATQMERLEPTKAKEVEIPSANGLSNAQSLGLVAAAIVSGKSKALATHAITNTEASAKRVTKLLHEIQEGAQLAMGDPITRRDELCCCETSFTRGGFNVFGDAFDNEDWPSSILGFCGWGGYGGSMMAWHPEQEIAISYVMNGNLRSSFFGFDDPRCTRLMDALRECVGSKEYLEPQVHHTDDNDTDSSDSDVDSGFGDTEERAEDLKMYRRLSQGPNQIQSMLEHHVDAGQLSGSHVHASPAIVLEDEVLAKLRSNHGQNILFVIEKSVNRNCVVYEANLGDSYVCRVEGGGGGSWSNNRARSFGRGGIVTNRH